MATLTGRAGPLLPGGEAAVRYQQRTYLVPQALPGELIRFHPHARRRGAWRGRLLEVIEASDQRVAPACAHADRCGGCALQHVHPGHQLAIKSAWVYEAFAQFMALNSDWQPITSGADLGGRRRVRWWRGKDVAGDHLGLRARASHRVIRIEHCPLVVAQLDDLRRRLAGTLPKRVQSVQMTVLQDGVHVVLEGDLPENRSVPVNAVGQRVQWWWRGQQGTRPLSRPVLTLHDRLSSGTGSIDVVVGPDDFVQGHSGRNADLIFQVQAWAAGARRIVDLFAGIGNLSLPLAAALSCRIDGAEANAASVAAANMNARRLGLDAHYQVMDLFAGVNAERLAGADVLILDPPRSGAKRVCRAMGRLLPGRIIMLSCDVAAGSRDAALLAACGYRLKALRAIDMFPYSGHVEAMSLWARS